MKIKSEDLKLEKCMQLTLFEETKEELLEREIISLRKEMGNIRRGIFARHSELARKYQETYFELETLKASIAKQEVDIWKQHTKSKSSIFTQKKKQIEDFQPLFTCAL